MRRADLHRLAKMRAKEAGVLLNARCYSGAYYLAGYAVECALKACIAKNVRRYEFPDKNLAFNSYTHKLEDLVKVAELAPTFTAARQQNPALSDNWQVVKDWKETSRYEIIAKATAKDMCSAVTDATDGVLPWLVLRW